MALVEDSSPVLAAVFAPATDEFFFAGRGQATTLNDQPVRAAAGVDLDFSRIAGPKPLVQTLSPSPDDITLHPRIGSLALRLCRVAQGSLDAAFAGGQSRDWDLAAANLIVQEADGKMSALSGDTIEYNRRDAHLPAIVFNRIPRERGKRLPSASCTIKFAAATVRRELWPPAKAASRFPCATRTAEAPRSYPRISSGGARLAGEAQPRCGRMRIDAGGRADRLMRERRGLPATCEEELIGCGADTARMPTSATLTHQSSADRCSQSDATIHNQPLAEPRFVDAFSESRP